MNTKKILKTLLYPHLAVLLILLLPVTTWLVFSMLYLPETSPIRIASYIVSFYLLVLYSLRIPKVIKSVKTAKNNNKYLSIWSADYQLRTNITLLANFAFNGAYAILQLATAIYHKSAWFYSLFGYYALLAFMRFFLVKHTLRHKVGEHIATELKYYRICGIVFLILNLSISGMMLYMIRENRIIHHNEITTIALATYTFGALALAIVNVVKYRKYNSPAVSAAKAISLATACVSILTLENTMLTIFSKPTMHPQTKTLFMAFSGGAISIFIIIMAIFMIVSATKNIKTKGTES